MLSDKASKKIDVLSFLLFIGVMLIHTNNLEVYEIGSEHFDFLAAVENGFSRISQSCVPIFFFISGFLFFRNFRIDMLTDKYKSRVKSVLIPYIIWNSLYYFLFAFLLKIPALARVVNSGQSVSVGISDYLKYIYDGYYVFWFLRILMWMILWTPVWYFLLKRRKYFLSEIALAALLIIALGYTPLPGSLVNAYYILGAYIGINFIDLANRSNKKLSIMAVISLPIIVFLSKRYAGQFLYHCLFFVAIWLALDLFSYKNDVKWWIRCTFFYYCAHDMILESIEKVILILGGKSHFMAAVDYIMAPILTLLIMIGVIAIMQKWMKPVWRILNGGRSGRNTRDT